MKKLFYKLFRPPITFGCDISNFVSVLDSVKSNSKSDDLFAGFIKSVDFNKRTIVIVVRGEHAGGERTVSFNDVVTIRRMKDGRLRMWIKNGGHAE